MFCYQISGNVLGLGALIPQIVRNHRRKASGDYSPVTATLGLCGCVTRMFTTLIRVHDSLMLSGSWNVNGHRLLECSIPHHIRVGITPACATYTTLTTTRVSSRRDIEWAAVVANRALFSEPWVDSEEHIYEWCGECKPPRSNGQGSLVRWCIMNRINTSRLFDYYNLFE